MGSDDDVMTVDPGMIPKVSRCNLKRIETRVESTRFHRLKLKCDELLSNFAFNIKLRRCTEELSTRWYGFVSEVLVVKNTVMPQLIPQIIIAFLLGWLAGAYTRLLFGST